MDNSCTQKTVNIHVWATARVNVNYVYFRNYGFVLYNIFGYN